MTDLITYKVKEGDWNFRPLENPLPWIGNKFTVEVIFDLDCYYSLDNWGGDRDWYDWNKLKGLTHYFSLNNKNSVITAFRPSITPGWMSLSPYINDKHGNAIYEFPDNTFEVECKSRTIIDVQIFKRHVDYKFKNETKVKKYKYNFKRPRFPIWREIGTSIGGADNSPGEYGGCATQPMTLHAKLHT